MAKKYIAILFIFTASFVWAQQDSLKIGDPYLEDQLYFDISYNVLYDQPELAGSSSFSYGISLGYLRDIPLKTSGTFALAIGLGYGYDSFNHLLQPLESTSYKQFQVADGNVTNNKFNTHTIEIPFQIRIRNSDANRYSFWRFYLGMKQSYSIRNSFRFSTPENDASYSNISSYNKWQTGLTVSAGYSTFNLYFYYGLTPILNNAILTDGTSIDTKMYKIGLSFYFL
ncbi:porin family protein [Tenacibaculum sp. SG-28]|uniref:porin family protein n=1 Tax=Tenacibaculum sp. SG-28 TaxID=754426 RepID=UPI000CF3BAE1|nr:porin family protein [Tenacibaculum sp. SG-28]PQJ21536.1 hypothetical protein BSU00_05310 [Tenacibaculum sp. SG-28]